MKWLRKNRNAVWVWGGYPRIFFIFWSFWTNRRVVYRGQLLVRTRLCIWKFFSHSEYFCARLIYIFLVLELLDYNLVVFYLRIWGKSGEIIGNKVKMVHFYPFLDSGQPSWRLGVTLFREKKKTIIDFAPILKFLFQLSSPFLSCVRSVICFHGMLA